MKYSRHNQLCHSCSNGIKQPIAPFCRQCCLPLDVDGSCFDCIHNRWHFKQLFACSIYDTTSARLALKLKHKGIGYRHIANSIYRLQAHNNIHLLVPVPLHMKRLLHRGFNQSELICKALSRLTNIPASSQLLGRLRNTSSQDGLGQQQRLENLKQAFIINTKLDTREYRNINILLIDDVVTTGSTIENCSRVLSEQLKCNVFAACWAKRILIPQISESI